jgi:hypothetical protein
MGIGYFDSISSYWNNFIISRPSHISQFRNRTKYERDGNTYARTLEKEIINQKIVLPYNQQLKQIPSKNVTGQVE